MNRCQQDRTRRERALNDAVLAERHGDMERRIEFEVGYDHRAFPDDCGGGGHGQHGMTLRFILIGPLGAVHWAANMTNWVPGNVHHGTIGADLDISLVPVNYPAIGDGMATDLGYHSPHPMWDGQDDYGRRDDCHLLPAGTCYYDGSTLNALARYYSDTFTAIEESSNG